MTPKETTILKGVAILFMLYLHLFNSMNQVELCTNLICIGESRWRTFCPGVRIR